MAPEAGTYDHPSPTERFALPEGVHVNLMKLGLYVDKSDGSTKLAQITFKGDDNKVLKDIKSKSPVN